MMLPSHCNIYVPATIITKGKIWFPIHICIHIHTFSFCYFHLKLFFSNSFSFIYSFILFQGEFPLQSVSGNESIIHDGKWKHTPEIRTHFITHKGVMICIDVRILWMNCSANTSFFVSFCSTGNMYRSVDSRCVMKYHPDCKNVWFIPF